MSNDEHWIKIRIKEAHKENPLVTDDVSVRVENLLIGELSARKYSTGELEKVAKALIEDMITPHKIDMSNNEN